MIRAARPKLRRAAILIGVAGGTCLPTHVADAAVMHHTAPLVASPGTSEPPTNPTTPEPTESSEPLDTTGSDPTVPPTTILEPVPSSNPELDPPQTDLALAIAEPGDPPVQANFQALVLGDRSIQFYLTAAAGGGVATLDFLLQRSLSSEGPWIDLATVSAWVALHTDSGLTPGTTYFYRVAARNEFGTSGFTMTSAIAMTYASAPLNPVGWPSNNSTVITWSPPAYLGGGPLLKYRIERTEGSSESWTMAGSVEAGVHSFVDMAALSGVTYRYRVAAVNGVGPGAFSTPVAATPYGVSLPMAPGSVAMTASPGSVQVSWLAPAFSGGVPIAGYVVYHSNDMTNWTATNLGPTTTSLTLSGLTPATTYHAVVYAYNAAGYVSPQSDLASATTPAPPTAPSVPRQVAMAAGPGSIQLSWLAPSSNGGAPIAGYVVYHSNDMTNWTATNLGPTTTSLTLSGLTPATTYHAVVYAYNANGYVSPQSNLASATTPAPTLPSVPRSVSMTATPGTIHLSWLAPSSDGGAPITTYYVYLSSDGTNWSGINLPETVTTVMIQGLAPATTRYAVVYAINNAGFVSPQSNLASATTPP